MPITATDIVFRYSTTSGSAGDTTAGAAATSLGKYVSTTVWTAGTAIFDDVSGAENAASESEYRLVFVLNNHATLSMLLTTAYIAAQVAGGAALEIGVDTTAASAKGSSSAQALQVANEDTAPAGVSFSAPTTDGAGISLGTLAPGQVRGVWLKRTTANNAAINADGATIGIGCDTAE